MDNEKKTISFELKNMKELSNLLEANKDSYHEIWVVLTKKEHANPQPVSFHEAQTEARKQGLVDSRSKSLNDKILHTVHEEKNRKSIVKVKGSWVKEKLERCAKLISKLNS